MNAIHAVMSAPRMTTSEIGIERSDQRDQASAQSEDKSSFVVVTRCQLREKPNKKATKTQQKGGEPLLDSVK